MIHKKLFMPFILGAALCVANPGLAQNGAPQKGIDPNALAEALKNCPGLNGKIDPQAMAKAAANCPGLNGTITGTKCPALNGQIDPKALAEAVANCPALNPNLPPQARKCPGLTGDPGNCPAFKRGGFVPGKGGFVGKQGGFVPNAGGFVTDAAPQAALDKKIDKKMNRIVKALERNKRSADALIQAAREAGADPNAISDMEKMSAAFRQVFMSTVSPQQIIESIFAAPQPEQAGPQGLIITGPDGSTWLVTPDGQNAQPAPQGRPGPRGPKQGKPMPPQDMAGQQGMSQGAPVPPPPPGPRPGKPMPPQGMRDQQPPAMQGAPVPPGPRPGKPMPPQGMRGQQPPAMQGAPVPPPPPGLPPQGFRAPQMQQPPQQAQQPQVIIMEETITPEYLPLWPTKEELGKDGVLKYLEKRSSVMNAN